MKFKLLLHLIFFLLITVSALSQVTGGEYTFIRPEVNRLFFSEDSSSYAALFRKIDRIERGKNERVKVVHIGGSHVQAGVWGNTFVSSFQTKYITAGGGYFVFPYRMAGTNGPYYTNSFSNGNWKLCRSVGKYYCLPLGMNALSATSNDSTNYFGVTLTRKAACKFVNVVKVYHNFNCSFDFDYIKSDSIRVKREDDPQKGYTRFEFDMPLDSVSFRLTRYDTLRRDFVLFGYSLENSLAPGFYLAGLGANGASTGSFLRSPYFLPQISTLDADLIVFSLGVNDTQSKGFSKEDFIANYDSLISLVREANPKAAILLTTTTDNYIRRKTPNRRTMEARDAMFELMRKHNVAVWDLYTLMGGYRSMHKWFLSGLASGDKVHFNNKGYTLVGRMMFEAVEKAYQQHNLKE
jgi:lysophospholipase L1-like esterase